MSARKAPVRRCSWHHCSKPAAARVRFELPNLLAGSERDYCQPHTELVCQANGTRVCAALALASKPYPVWAAPALGLRRPGGARPTGRG